MLKQTERVVIYKRVSTARQGRSGLGLDAQEALIASYLGMTGAERISSYEEAESGKKRVSERPELSKALAECKAMKATLLVAALSRMGRNRAEILTLIDESGVKVAFADEPHASSLSIGIKAVVADDEGKAISYRTKAALAAAKARGVKLGNPNGARALKRHIRRIGNGAGCEGATRAADEFAKNLRSYVAAMVQNGMTNATMAATLNDKRVPTRREGAKWYETSVKNLRQRLAI
jgi:DNA invertase Pin-like site-specific DNA recombinase